MEKELVVSVGGNFLGLVPVLAGSWSWFLGGWCFWCLLLLLLMFFLLGTWW